MTVQSPLPPADRAAVSIDLIASGGHASATSSCTLNLFSAAPPGSTRAGRRARAINDQRRAPRAIRRGAPAYLNRRIGG